MQVYAGTLDGRDMAVKILLPSHCTPSNSNYATRCPWGVGVAWASMIRRRSAEPLVSLEPCLQGQPGVHGGLQELHAWCSPQALVRVAVVSVGTSCS